MIQVTFPADLLDVFLRLSLAALLGATVGYERDIHGRAAGLRTQLLVCVGSALFMLVSLGLGTTGGAVNDPGRLVSQVVTGIGFLGAGVILKEGVSVRGMTTAACLWVTAAIGIAAGGGLYAVAVFTCLMTLVTLVALKAFEKTFARDMYRRAVVVTRQNLPASRIPDIIRGAGISVVACETDQDFVTGHLTANVDVRIFHKGSTERVAEKILEALKSQGIEVDRFAWRR